MKLMYCWLIGTALMWLEYFFLKGAHVPWIFWLGIGYIVCTLVYGGFLGCHRFWKGRS